MLNKKVKTALHSHFSSFNSSFVDINRKIRSIRKLWAMSWLPKTSRTVRIVAGLAVSASAFAWVVNARDLKEDGPQSQKRAEPAAGSVFNLGKVLASWTTNFKPSTPWDTNWDRREPKSLVEPFKQKGSTDETENDYKNKLKQATPTVSRHLLLIRHGQYFLDPETDEARILTPLGREQAELTGKRLKELDFPYTTVINSSMTRAKETSDLIHKQLGDVPRKQCDLLREGAPIPPEPPVGHWRPEPTFYRDGARIEAAFRRYLHRADPSQEKDSYEVIVCHANVIRFIVCRALQFPPEAWLRLSLFHGSITWLTVRPNGRVHLKALGDAGHMPASKLTSS